MSEVARIDVSEAGKLLQGIEIVAMCDIDNPMYGKMERHMFLPPRREQIEKWLLLLTRSSEALRK